MKITFEDIRTWKVITNAVSMITSEALIKLNPEELRISAMDDSHVALVDLELPASSFKHFNVPGFVELGTYFDLMKRIVSRGKSGDELTLEVDEGQNELILILHGDSTRRFTLPLIAPEREELPDLNFRSCAVLKTQAGVLKRGLEDAKLAGGTVVLKATPREFVIQSRGDTGEFNLTLKPEGEDVDSLDVGKPGKSAFSTDRLLKMVRVIPSKALITVKIGENLPVRLSHTISDDGKLEFVLAPRVIKK